MTSKMIDDINSSQTELKHFWLCEHIKMAEGSGRSKISLPTADNVPIYRITSLLSPWAYSVFDG